MTPSEKRRKSYLVLPSDTMDEAGRRVMRYYLARMVAHERGVLDGWDVDDLHDMRVAARRLRVACRLFRKTFGKEALRPFARRLRRVGQDLGQVRDLDVFIEFLDEYVRRQGLMNGIGIEALRAHLAQQRRIPRAHLRKQLQRKRHAGFKEEFQAWLARPAGPRKAGKRPVMETAPALCDRRRTEVLAYEALVGEKTPPGTFHALRIACKHLRYTAEFFNGCYDRRLAPLIKRMTELQDLLGRYHDADVHIVAVSDYISRLSRRSSRARRIQAELEEMISYEHRIQDAYLDRFWPVWRQAVFEMRALDFHAPEGCAGIVT